MSTAIGATISATAAAAVIWAVSYMQTTGLDALNAVNDAIALAIVR